MRLTTNLLWSVTLLCVLVIFSSCAKEEPIIAAKNQEEFSSQDQNVIGARLVNQVREDDHNFPIFKSDNTAFTEELNVYLTRLLQTVTISVPVVNRNDFQWGITVIDAPDIHLFTAPGGHFFVYTGLLKALDSEAQLIAMMAHELKYTDESKTILSLKDEFGGVAMGDILLGNEVASIDNMALWLRDLSYSEEEVLEADQYALNIICPYLYDNEGLRAAIMQLDNVAEQTVDWLVRRPGTTKRIELLEIPLQDCGSNESDFAARYRSMIAKL